MPVDVGFLVNRRLLNRHQKRPSKRRVFVFTKKSADYYADDKVVMAELKQTPFKKRQSRQDGSFKDLSPGV